MIRTALMLSMLLLFCAACGGGSQANVSDVDSNTPVAGCDGFCADTPTQLSVADVEGVIARAVAETGGQIAVFGHKGSRPLNLQEMKQLYLDEDGKYWYVKYE